VTLTQHDIREALDPPTVRAMQMTQISLTIGVVLFAAFTYVRAMYLVSPGAVSGGALDEGVIRLFSSANAALLVAAFLAGHLLFRNRVGARAEDAAARVAALRVGALLRLALLEAAALFGVVTCFLATPAGPPADPIVWLNLISPAAFVLFSAVTFPTRDKLAEILAD
jgi:hypothetical protein